MQTLLKPAAPPANELTGTVRGILWSDWGAEDSSGAFIVKLTDEQIVKGQCPEGDIEVGMAYRFLGRFTEHWKHGKQFQASTFVKATPATRVGVVRYLVKLAPNFGEVRANRLYDVFGAEAVKVLRQDPRRVAETGIVDLQQAEDAAESLGRFAGLEDTRIELFGLFDKRGFPGTLTNVCIARWQARAAEKIRRNPFLMLTAKLPGCGFKRTDKMWLDLGHPAHRLKRQMLCAWYSLREDNSGHTWFPMGFAKEAVRRSVEGTKAAPLRAIELGIRAQWLATLKAADGQEWIAEARKGENERVVASRIRQLLAGPPTWSAAEMVPGVLSDHQFATVAVPLSSRVGILAGTPGTGKTFTAAQVVKYLACKFGLKQIAVCAPTGKAAVRCTAAMLGYGIDLPAKTIHRMLEIGRNGHDGDGWGFLRNETNPLDERFLVVDEGSMLDTDLAASLLLACAPGTHVLFVGDPYQLPPVGHGAPLRDMIAAGVPCGELSEIRRNAGLIVRACASIKAGSDFETTEKYDPDAGMNLRHVEAPKPETAVETLKAILGRFRVSGRFDPAWDCQVLVAVNQRSKVSRVELNKILQGELNPGGMTAKLNPFRVGDKIICLKNSGMPLVNLQLGRRGDDVDSYGSLGVAEFVANGEIGKVMAVAPKVAIARFTMPDRLIRIGMGAPKASADGDGNSEDSVGTGCDFDLAYACTCHKLQGSEAPVVIVMVDDSGGAKQICSREWVYTALSRASKLCITIGKREVLAQQCRRQSLSRRRTFLKELLTEQK